MLCLVHSSSFVLAIITRSGQLTPLRSAVKSSKQEVKSVFTEKESASGKDGRRSGLEDFRDQHGRFLVLRRRAQACLILVFTCMIFKCKYFYIYCINII